MSRKSRSRLAADWFARLRLNATTQEVEHEDVVAEKEASEAAEAKAITDAAAVEAIRLADVAQAASDLAAAEAAMDALALKTANDLLAAKEAADAAREALALKTANDMVAAKQASDAAMVAAKVIADAELATAVAGATMASTDILTSIKTVDGSGSGLDADLLDGKQASAFALAHSHPYLPTAGKAADSNLLDGINSTGFAKAQGRVITDCNHANYRIPGMYGFSGNPTNGTGESYGTMIVAANSDTGLQIAGGYSNDDLYFRGWWSSGGGYSSWRKTWHAGNDGSGSGLDADLLDGKQASDFALKAGNAGQDFYTDDLFYDQWIRNNSTGASGLYWHNTANDGYGWHLYPQSRSDMTMRTGSGSGGIKGTIVDDTARGYVHWTTSNEIGFLNSSRSWSMRCDNSGNTFATSSHRAPIFYDSNNTGYYVNPASTSKLNRLDVDIMYDKDNTAYYVRPGSTSILNDCRANIFYSRSNTGYYSDPESTSRLNAVDMNSGTLRGNLVVPTGNRDDGIFGTYDSTKTQHIWSMGTAYKNNSAGSNFGNLYGLAYKHTNNGTGGTMGSGHMMVWCQNGTPYASLGSNIWSKNNITAYSDIRVKENLEVIPNAIDKVKQLNGYTYDRTDLVSDTPEEEDTVYLHNPKNRHVGVIAQEVLKVLPEAVTGGPSNIDGTEDDHYSVAYGNLVALLIEGMKEQNVLIEDQRSVIDKMNDRLTKLETK